MDTVGLFCLLIVLSAPISITPSLGSPSLGCVGDIFKVAGISQQNAAEYEKKYAASPFNLNPTDILRPDTARIVKTVIGVSPADDNRLTRCHVNHATRVCRNHNLCSSHGTCNKLTRHQQQQHPSSPPFVCACQPGYKGHLCQTEACASRPCLNNGQCKPSTTASRYTCQCKGDYYGKRCEKLRDICTPNPCAHGGVCTALPRTGSFSCSCKNGFIGKTCQQHFMTEVQFSNLLQTNLAALKNSMKENLALVKNSMERNVATLKNFVTASVASSTTSLKQYIHSAIESLKACRKKKVYHGYTERVNWITAVHRCSQKGMKLAEVDNAAEQAAVARVYDRYRQHMWIGASDQQHEGVFRWSTGRLVTYSNWVRAKPDNFRYVEDCVHAAPAWSDARCSDRMMYLCQRCA